MCTTGITLFEFGSYKKKVQNAKRGRGNPAPTVSVARFLNMNVEFYVSRSLSVQERVHKHCWTLKLYVRGTPKNGMVIDILKLRQLTDPYAGKLADTYLDKSPVLTEGRASCPTCEAFAAYFYTHVFQALEELGVGAELKAVEAGPCELEGKKRGAPRLEAD